MLKKNVSTEQLIKWINAEIQRHEGCEEIVLTGIHHLQDRDPEGNNWSAGSARVTGVPDTIWGPVVDNVLREAKRLFNLM